MSKEVDLLQQLVAIPSVSGQEKMVVNFLVGQAEKLNFDQVKKDQVGNFVARRGQGKTTILLVGHIDTVPGEIPIRIENNKLYGRGSVDAKGSLATFIWATHNLGKIKDKTIYVIGCVEEEIASSKGARNLLDKYNPDYIVIGEPSGVNNIIIGYKGGVRFSYSHSRELSHYSVGQPTIAEQAILFINQVKKYLEDHKPTKNSIFLDPFLEIRNFNTNNNGLEERVVVNCNLRIPPGFNPARFKEFLQAYPVKISEDTPAVLAPKNNGLIRAFLQTIRQNGGEPKFVKKTGSSDMNILNQHWPEVPIVAYGPGDSKLDHTPGEYLKLEEYNKAIGVLGIVLDRL